MIFYYIIAVIGQRSAGEVVVHRAVVGDNTVLHGGNTIKQVQTACTSTARSVVGNGTAIQCQRAAVVVNPATYAGVSVITDRRRLDCHSGAGINVDSAAGISS